MLLHMFHGVIQVAVQLIFFELNYITPWKHHTSGNDPKTDILTPSSPGSSLQQTVLGKRSHFMCIHYSVLSVAESYQS